MGKKNSLDKFYTRADVADSCVKMMHSIDSLGNYDVIIEPSAGDGAFLPYLPSSTIAYDIAPESSRITQADFLKVNELPFNGSDNENVRALFIGNPPFGTRGSLAKKFIEHCISLGATTIAFILPNTFSKETNQRMFGSDWRLIERKRLPRDSFTLDGAKYHVPCSFYVWTRDESIQKTIDLRAHKPAQPKDYRFLRRGDPNADFSLNGNNGKTKSIGEITNPKAEHYIKACDAIEPEELRRRFDSLSFDFESSANGGVAWINRDDINKAYSDAYAHAG